MIGKHVQFNRWSVLSLLLMVFFLALAVPPALAHSAMDETGRLEASHSGNFVTDPNCETMGVLGPEGGLLSLLGGDGYAEPIAALVKGETYSLQAVHNGQSATYVVYIRADCLGRGVVQLPGSDDPPMFLPNSNPFGKSYGEWTAEWWKWYLSIPASVHPAADETGTNCAQRQSSDVWFLAGAADGTAERACAIPTDQAILFPIIDAECSTAEPDPFHGDNEAELKACVDAIGFSKADELVVTLDGKAVKNLFRYRTQSPLFDFALPDDNILGVDATQGQSVADGYYVILPPLSRGEHVLFFKGVLGAGPFTGFSQEVTYRLTIGK